MKIAITGTIGSGKSTVSLYLREKGFYVFDCDEYNSYLLTDVRVINQIASKFDNCIIDKTIDKKALAKIVFNDKNKKKELEDILHPLIIEHMISESKKHNIFMAEVPLLFECNLDRLFDHNLLITCDKEIAIERLKNRGFSQNEANDRINNQLDVQTKISRADEIIYNNSTLLDLYKKIDEWLSRYVG